MSKWEGDREIPEVPPPSRLLDLITFWADSAAEREHKRKLQREEKDFRKLQRKLARKYK
jgi:hypothetical protein